MNAKNIILAILMVLSFAACSSEIEGIDDNMTNTNVNVNNGETSISVRMLTEGVDTKADILSEEMAINNFVIAVFEAESGQRIGYADSQNSTNGAILTKVTVEGIEAKEGRVNVVVVANAGIERFKNIYSYEEFGNQLVENSASNGLVKVGTRTQSLSKGENNPMEIDLLQLTARVKVELNYTTTGVGANTVDISFKAIRCSYTATAQSTVLNPDGPVNQENLIGSEYIMDPLDATSLSYDTYRINNPKLSVTTKLTVTVNDKVAEEGKIKEVDVPFTTSSGYDVLRCLENGKIYTQVITVNIDFNISQDVNPHFTYEVAPIHEVENEVIFE